MNYLQENSFQEIPLLAKIKAGLIRDGISLESKTFFNQFKGIARYKTKNAALNPQTKNFKVFDASKELIVIPSEIILFYKKDKSLIKLRYNPLSPFCLKSHKSSLCLFFEKNPLPVKLELVKKMNLSCETVNLVGIDRLSVLFFDGCWNWNTGSPCKFCDLHPRKKSFKSVIPNLNDLVDFKFDYKRWWETKKGKYFQVLKRDFKAASKKENLAPHRHLLLMSGGFIDNHFYWENIVPEVLGVLNQVEPLENFDNYLNVPPPPDQTISFFKKVKNLGVRQVEFNLEVYGKKNFENVCPGKGQNLGYNKYMEALKKAVKVFGAGNSRTNFVLGAQPVKELLKGVDYLASLGIVSDYSIFQPKKGTPWAKKKALPLADIFYFNSKLAKIYKKYKFKPIYCSLGSRSSIINECLGTWNTRNTKKA